jgi:GT2 family glycosyltransferase
VVGPRLVVWGAEDHLNSLGLNLTEAGEAWDEGIGVTAAEYGEIPEAREVVAVTGAALMIRPHEFAMLRGWSERYRFYFEDVDLCLRAWERGWTVRMYSGALAAHRVSATAGQQSRFKRYLSWRNQLVLVATHWPIALLLRSAPRLVASQGGVFWRRVRSGAWSDARLQLRAWIGAALLLPGAMAARFGRGSDYEWTRLLRRPGTVPAIHLPEAEALGDPWASEAAR